MRERLPALALVAISIVMTTASMAQAESATATGVLSGLSSYGATVGTTLKAMLVTLDRRIGAINLLPSISSDPAVPPVAVVKFSTTNTDGNPVPCELTLAKLRAVEASSPPSAADKARFESLQRRGIERCHANDDKQANAYLSEALGMVGR